MGNENTKLVAAIQRAVTRIDPARTLEKKRDFADFFGLDTSVFSKYWNGERSITPLAARKMAQAWADRATASDFISEEDRESFVSELLEANPEVDETNAAASAFLRARGKPGNFLLGEFRDLPVARPTGGDDSLPDYNARAIADGLTYAMVWPFSEESTGEQASPQIRDYLSAMWSFVQAAYTTLLSRTVAAIVQDHVAQDEAASEVDIAALTTEIHEAIARIRLYRLNKKDPRVPYCPGFASKVFQVHDKNSKPEIWIWVSSDEREHVIKKRTDQIELAALAERFFPIFEYFKAKSSLPDTEQLKQFADEDPNLRKNHWEEIPLRKETKKRIIERELKEYRQAHAAEF